MLGLPNWENRTVFTGDNVDILRGMNSESVDLIYLDPPFNSNRNYSAPVGSEATGAAFKDTWELSDVDLSWYSEIADKEPTLYAVIETTGLSHGDGMKAYLIMIAIRVLELRRILKPTGSIYLHCDPTSSHYLKMLMDCICGKDNFNNEIIWCYSTSGRASRGKRNRWAQKHDTILWYAKNIKQFKADCTVPVSDAYIESHYRQVDSKGRKCRVRVDAGKERVYYPDEGINGNDWWADIPYVNSQAKDRMGYPTQKPLELLERIIESASNEGDVVLDPFCGSGTALVAAEQLNRKWVGIDLSELAAELVVSRLEQVSNTLWGGKVHHRLDLPKRADL